MGSPARSSAIIALRALAAFALAACGAENARADEVAARAAPTGLVVHDADETLARWCAADSEGRLWLALPGGMRFELITSTTDAAIANPGDGAFHPFDPAQVRAALASVRFPIATVRAEIFLLPFPRRGGLESAAGPGLILLSPGVLEIPVEHQHSQLVHELGHVVHYQMLPDADVSGWSRYRSLRGIADASTYSASSPHADRPHEIFAEDFRALFGGALATYSGSIENATLAPPAAVAGLDAFMHGLAGSPATLSISVSPNPARGAIRFARPGPSSAVMDVFDVGGRRLATLSPSWDGSSSIWSWDGRAAGTAFRASGVCYARVRDRAASSVRVTLVP